MDTTALRIASAALVLAALAACANDHRPEDDGSVDAASRETVGATQVSHDAGSIDPAACVPVECAGMVGEISYFYASDCAEIRCHAKGGTLPLNTAATAGWTAGGDCQLYSTNLAISFRTTAGQVLAQNSQRDRTGSPWHETGAPVALRCTEVPARTAKPETLVPVAQDAGAPIADSGTDAAETADSAVTDAGLPIADAGTCTPVTCEKPAGFATYSYWTDCDTIRCSVRGIPGVNDGPEAETDWTAGGDCEFEASGFVATFAIEPGRGLIAHLRQTLNDGGLSPLGNGLALDCEPR